MIGKTLRSAGVDFHVLHCGPSPVPVNTQPAGSYEGITFEYTTGLKRPEDRLVRLLVYIRAVTVLTIRLMRMWPERRRTLVHLYVMIGPLNLYVGWLCTLLRIPVAQELCEWWPGVDVCDRFTRWLHKKSMFRRATGVLVISKEIERRALGKKAEVNPGLVIHRLPAIVDFARFASAPAAADCATFTYCGTWFNDICFCIEALAIVQRRGYATRLTIVGSSAEFAEEIYQFAARQGVGAEDIILTGCVDEAGLAACYRSALALLLPMRDDDQSRTRMPNKLAEYLAAGRPVVAGKIGELTGFLVDGDSAYLAEPGSESDFAGKMIEVIEDPERADRIGAAGQAACRKYLDYTVHAQPLAQFVHRCIQQQSRRKRSAHLTMTRIYIFVRNLVCGLIALYLIAAGNVRRARKKAMSGGVVTSVYFHNPSKKLFRRCVDWLTKNGYRFISTRDLIEILRGEKTPPRGAVWLSFDDGFRSLQSNVIPLARERKIPVTLFIPTGIIENGGLFPWLPDKGSRHSLTVAELKAIAQYPEVTLGSHTVNHSVTRNLSENDLHAELADSKRTLLNWTGVEPNAFAYPVGRFRGNENTALERCGYTLAVTTENAFITSRTDPYFVPRFSIGDNITYPEAICNMVGVWRPVVDPLIRFFYPPPREEEEPAVRPRARSTQASSS